MNTQGLTRDGLRTATAMVAAHHRGDVEAMVELWNVVAEDTRPQTVCALAALPAIIVEQLTAASGLVLDLDGYLDGTLRALAAEDG